MQRQMFESIDYRGLSIAIKVEPNAECVYGQADVFDGAEFRGRLACSSTQRQPEEIHQKVRCLAKAKVDAWSLINRHNRHTPT